MSTEDGRVCEYPKNAKFVCLVQNAQDESTRGSSKPITNGLEERRDFGHIGNYGIKNLDVQTEDTDFLLDMEGSEFEEQNESDWDEVAESEEEQERDESADAGSRSYIPPKTR